MAAVGWHWGSLSAARFYVVNKLQNDLSVTFYMYASRLSVRSTLLCPRVLPASWNSFEFIGVSLEGVNCLPAK